MDRVQFITHHGTKVLFVDVRGCAPDEVMEISEQTQEVVTAQPRGSVLLVADFTGVHLDKESVTRIKETATRHVPYVRRAAWVGTGSIPETWMRSIETFSTRKLEPFDTLDAALDWVVSEQAGSAHSH